MTSEAMVVDVSRDWMLACDVQERFMRGMDSHPGVLDYGGRWAAIAMTLYRSTTAVCL